MMVRWAVGRHQSGRDAAAWKGAVADLLDFKAERVIQAILVSREFWNCLSRQIKEMDILLHTNAYIADGFGSGKCRSSASKRIYDHTFAKGENATDDDAKKVLRF